MINNQIIVTDDYGNKFYEIHEDGEIFDYTNNEVLKTNFFDQLCPECGITDKLHRNV